MEPTQFGNYTLLERISHGGMAEVYRAKSFGEAGFEREVALKLLLPSMASDAEFVNMLIDEAKIAGQLNHANIAQIFDLGVTDGRYYIVQEYVSGQDLRAILQHKSDNQTPLEIATSCHIALKICEGLYYAHNKQDPSGGPLNLVHRDISPHNILISNEGEVKIIDFGIAKAEGRSTQTMAGLVKGKFAYMSPEQIRGLPVDHRSDVFATGILLHEMLSNRSLFRRSSEFETLKRARSATAEPPSQFNARVPPALDKITLKALARHVDDRYQSALELRDALWAFAREHNSFSDPNAFARAKGGDGTHSSIEIELASEVSKLIEIQRGDGNERDYSYDLGGEDDEDGEDEPESATMVDPRLPFGTSSPDDDDTTEAGGEQDIYTPTDHDAQWARDVGGPLRSASPFAMPPLEGNNRPTKKLAAVVEEETTSNRGDRREPSTDRYGQGTPLSLDEPTAEKVAPVRERLPSAPVKAPLMQGKGMQGVAVKREDPGRARNDEPSPRPPKAAVAEPVSRQAPGRPAPEALKAIALAPTLAAGLPVQRQSPVPLGAGPAPGNLAQQQPYPSREPSRERSREPSRAPSREPSRAPSREPSRERSREPSQPAIPHQAQAMPLQAPSPYPQPGYAPSGYPEAPLQPEYPQQGYLQQGYGSAPYPQQSSGQIPVFPQNDPSSPYPYPFPSSDSGSAPYALPLAGSGPIPMGPATGLERGPPPGPRRLYLLMSAIFVLLLAGAATITLVITG